MNAFWMSRISFVPGAPTRLVCCTGDGSVSIGGSADTNPRKVADPPRRRRHQVRRKLDDEILRGDRLRRVRHRPLIEHLVRHAAADGSHIGHSVKRVVSEIHL